MRADTAILKQKKQKIFCNVMPCVTVVVSYIRNTLGLEIAAGLPVLHYLR